METGAADENGLLPVTKNDPYANSLILQLRGFPFSVTQDEVFEFLEIGVDDVSEFMFVKGTNGKQSGECFVVCPSVNVRDICMKKHKQNYAETGRYVDVFKSSEEYFNRRVSINDAFD